MRKLQSRCRLCPTRRASPVSRFGKPTKLLRRMRRHLRGGVDRISVGTAPVPLELFAGFRTRNRCGNNKLIMSRAYLLILVPAAVVGVFYFFIFHNFGMAIHPAPFLGTLGLFVVAVVLVRRYQSINPRRSRRP